jgi:site-specific DNA-methyltransferase (adenine-specific)
VKPYYEDDGCTIYHGDCHAVTRDLDLSTVGSVVSDPPYGVKWVTDYRRFNGWASGRGYEHLPVANDDKPFDPSPWLSFPQVILWGAHCYSDGLPRGRWLIWDKRFASGKAFLADGEAAWMKGGFGVYIYSQVFQGEPRRGKFFHPTQKPVELMLWCLKKCKRPSVVLDPFMGSGTTLVAARLLGCRAIGIEIEEKYCEVAAGRLSQKLLPFDNESVGSADKERCV